MVRGRGPDLLTVDDIFVAVMLGGSLQRGEVRPRTRLGKALAPPIVDIGGGRQEALLSLLVPELAQHGADLGNVERRPFGGGAKLVLLEEYHALHRCPAGAAVLL